MIVQLDSAGSYKCMVQCMDTNNVQIKCDIGRCETNSTIILKSKKRKKKEHIYCLFHE